MHLDSPTRTLSISDRTVVFFVCFVAALLFLSAAQGDSPELLPNLQPVADGIYSGGEPASDAAFARLAELGIKTVISVDGVKPNLLAAGRRGMRYIHIPFGYDGIPAEAGLALTRAAREAAMPVYVHCHHGHHRAPAAAAVLGIACDRLNGAQAIAFMKLAGTSPDYRGLWRDVRSFKPPAEGTPLPDLVESAKLDGLQEAMGKLDRDFDRLKTALALDSNNKDEDTASRAESALLVLEGFREGLRAGKQDPGLQAKMRAAEKIADQTVRQLASGNLIRANDGFTSLKQNCVECHRIYRD